jgi:hypothetical protein
MTSENSAITSTSVAHSFHNPFQGPGAEETWKRLLAQPSRVVSREEMIRRAQERAAAKQQ